MNSAIHHFSATERQAELSRCRRHALADVPPRERRLSAFGARLFGLVRPKPVPVPTPLRPAVHGR
jgi:hypothetical protein